MLGAVVTAATLVIGAATGALESGESQSLPAESTATGDAKPKLTPVAVAEQSVRTPLGSAYALPATSKKASTNLNNIMTPNW